MPNPSTVSNNRNPPIHHMKPELGAPADAPTEALAYAWGGKEVPADSKDAVAKAVAETNSTRVRYYVKRATMGVNANQFYAPTNLLFNAATVARDRYEWRPVSEAVFKHYVEYIRTRNPLHLKHAERA